MVNNKKIEKLSDSEIEKVVAGSDTDSLKITGKPVPLPMAKSKKECDGGYAGPTSLKLEKEEIE